MRSSSRTSLRSCLLSNRFSPCSAHAIAFALFSMDSPIYPIVWPNQNARQATATRRPPKANEIAIHLRPANFSIT